MFVWKVIRQSELTIWSFFVISLFINQQCMCQSRHNRQNREEERINCKKICSFRKKKKIIQRQCIKHCFRFQRHFSIEF